MKLHTKVAALVVALLFGSATAFADAGKVKIMHVSPDIPYAKDKIMLTYEATASAEGDHLHLNVDGKRVDIIHELKGTAEVNPLPSGKHRICLALNTKAHVPTGAEDCTDVTVW